MAIITVGRRWILLWQLRMSEQPLYVDSRMSRSGTMDSLSQAVDANPGSSEVSGGVGGIRGTWTAQSIAAAIKGSETLRVNLKTPIRILILYGTALATEDGSVQFFDDICAGPITSSSCFRCLARVQELGRRGR